MYLSFLCHEKTEGQWAEKSEAYDGVGGPFVSTASGSGAVAPKASLVLQAILNKQKKCAEKL